MEKNPFSSGHILVIAEDEGSKVKKKKGDGINAVLTLMKEMRDFQDRVEECIESQDLAEHKAKIQDFNNYVESMYEVLLDIAKGGLRKERAGEVPVESPVPEALPKETAKTEVKETPKVVAPVPPKA